MQQVTQPITNTRIKTEMKELGIKEEEIELKKTIEQQ